jgi:uncharacterized protein YndB with AHSA1/START domain
MFKAIVIAIVVLVAGFAGVVALQPAEFEVARSVTIGAPPAKVFEHVNDLHKWDAWSPWAKLDPNAKIGFEGAPSGKGAVFTWAGNEKVGEGRMTVVDSRPGELVRINVDFKAPFEGSSASEFAFKPEGSQTAVTWTMSGHRDFVGKAFCLIMNGQAMMGGDMEKGLAQLKAVAEGRSS